MRVCTVVTASAGRPRVGPPCVCGVLVPCHQGRLPLLGLRVGWGRGAVATGLAGKIHLEKEPQARVSVSYFNKLIQN